MRTDSSKSSNQASSTSKTVVEQYTTSKGGSKSQHSTPIIEQYTTAAGRHASSDSHLNIPHSSRPSDALYQQPLLNQMPPPSQALPTQAMLQGPPPRLPLSQGQPPSQSIIPGQQAESYQLSSMSAMAPGRKTNLITVPLQDDSDYRRRDMAAGYNSLPPSTFATSMPPPGGIAPQQGFPAMHQGPSPTSIGVFPPSGPPPFTSPPIRSQLPVSSGGSVPISHPPPVSVPTPIWPHHPLHFWLAHGCQYKEASLPDLVVPRGILMTVTVRVPQEVRIRGDPGLGPNPKGVQVVSHKDHNRTIINTTNEYCESPSVIISLQYYV